VTSAAATTDTPFVRRRRLGSKGPLVTPIGLGLAALGRPGYINLGRDRDLGPERTIEALRQRTHEVLDAAWSAGIRYFDAARSYGLAESFLADWLTERRIDPAGTVVGSKWGYTYTADWEVGAVVNEIKDHSLATFQRQFAESRSFLGPWLRLYQVHSATLESGVLADEAVLTALARAREDDLVIGLSVSGPRQAATIRQAMEVRVDGLPLFGAVQATWNVLEPSAGEALGEAHRAGMGVIVKEALANGRLIEMERGRRLAAGTAATPDSVAIAAALAQPWADMVLSGAVTRDQVVSNVTAVELTLDADDLDRFAELAEDPATYWSTRSELAWT
jgi:aryl-alcohol dehydrogenase-like predicted oxidoreductase